jgi:hypothetical protein
MVASPWWSSNATTFSRPTLRSASLRSCLAIPAVRHLNPTIHHNGEVLVLATRPIVAVRRSGLRRAGSAAGQGDEITRAVDVLTSGGLERLQPLREKRTRHQRHAAVRTSSSFSWCRSSSSRRSFFSAAPSTRSTCCRPLAVGDAVQPGRRPDFRLPLVVLRHGRCCGRDQHRGSRLLHVRLHRNDRVDLPGGLQDPNLTL